MNLLEKYECPNICPEKILCIPAEEIFRHYGFEHQVSKTIEELQELEDALEPAAFYMDVGQSCPATSLHPILTECADVIIMCAQLLRLDAVLYPVDLKPRARTTMNLAHYVRVKVLSKPMGPLDTGFHLSRSLIDEAIRVALAISSKERLQEEILFKIRRQEERIAVELEAAKAREEAERKKRAAARAAVAEVRKAAKNAAKIAASTKKEKDA